MSDSLPWLTIVGIGEDGVKGLGTQAIAAVNSAKMIMGASRHLELLGPTSASQMPWPIPFKDGLSALENKNHRPMVVLASGDPFWFGAGTTITKSLSTHEWHAIPNQSSFSLAASHLGWPLEKTVTLGLHAAPFEMLRPHLQPHKNAPRLLITMRDTDAVGRLCDYLCSIGFGQTSIWVLSALGGARQHVYQSRAQEFTSTPDMVHPVMVGLIPMAHQDKAMPCSSGLSDDHFDHDGQITKRPVRALTLSALAPKAAETLLDIGGGSGSIAIEWLLCHPQNQATVIEKSPQRVARIKSNAAALGQHRLEIIQAVAMDALEHLPSPDVIFIGGGLSHDLLSALSQRFEGTRIVANAVTLESTSILTQWQKEHGGTLLKIDLSHAEPVGKLHAWKAAYPIVQWSGVL